MEWDGRTAWRFRVGLGMMSTLGIYGVVSLAEYSTLDSLFFVSKLYTYL
jgi:hypothetical protein